MSALTRRHCLEDICTLTRWSTPSAPQQKIDLRVFTQIVDDDGPPVTSIARDLRDHPPWGTMWRPSGSRYWRGGQVDLVELVPQLEDMIRFQGGMFEAIPLGDRVKAWDFELVRFPPYGSGAIVMTVKAHGYTVYEKRGFRIYDAMDCSVTNIEARPHWRSGQPRMTRFP